MNTIVTIALPVGRESFGGIVGSRIHSNQTGAPATVQIAYLEKGRTARVRFIETNLQSVVGPVNLVSVTARDTGHNLPLELEIVIGPEKQSTDPLD